MIVINAATPVIDRISACTDVVQFGTDVFLAYADNAGKGSWWRTAWCIAHDGPRGGLSKAELLAVARLWAAHHNIEVPWLLAQKGEEDEA